MSTRFTVICGTCDVVGPHIRRHHQGAFLMAADSARLFPEHDEVQTQTDWGSFLIEHAYHDLRLETEWRSRVKQEPEQTKPTHRLLADGSLEEIE